MNWNVGTKMAAGFGMTLVIFVIVGVVSYQSAARLVETSEWTHHTYEAVAKLAQLQTTIKEIEASSRSFLLTSDAPYMQQFDAAQRALDRQLDELRKLTADNPRQQERIARLEMHLRDRIAIAAETLETRRTQGLDAALAIVRSGRGKAAMDQSLRTLAEMDDEEARLLAARREATDDDSQDVRAAVIYGTAIAIVFAALAGIILGRNIARPLGALTAAADRVTEGDLSVDVPVDETRKDEVSALARAFNRMTRSLRTMAGIAEQIAAGDLRATLQPQSPKDQLGTAFVRMVENLRRQISSMAEGASALGSAATEIVASTVQLASGASQSAAAVSETTTTVEEVRQTAHIASQKAKAVSDSAQRAVQISEGGLEATGAVVTGMGRIRQQMEAIGASMMRLSEQGQTIGQIIATVEDLAAQSNLLAVNAAIEAAKAGEYGKGFGVVAQEVKSLAEQSRQATDRVRTILGDIQKATTAAVLATEQGSKAVEAGDRQTESAGGSIQNLANTVAEAAQAATQIAASSQQQLVGMDQVAVAMENIRQASAQNVASAKQLEMAARGLNDVGQRLKQTVERYVV
jgi:methyl-accepting chemotaxis protein